MATTRILVVDDEEDLCEILKFNLEIEGYEVDTAYSAEEALKKDLTVYNLLLLDVMMREISGFKMARIPDRHRPIINAQVYGSSGVTSWVDGAGFSPSCGVSGEKFPAGLRVESWRSISVRFSSLRVVSSSCCCRT